MGTEALIKKGLLNNTTYEVLISLNNGDVQNQQTERITLTTPKFISNMSSYKAESTVLKNLTSDVVYHPGITYPGYTYSTTYTYTLTDIDVVFNDVVEVCSTTNVSKLAKMPTCTITLTFNNNLVTKKTKWSDAPHLAVQGAVTPFYDLLTDRTGGTVNDKKITFTRAFDKIDPTITLDSWRKATNNVYGFWDSDIYKKLYNLKTKKLSTTAEWKLLKNCYITYTDDKTVDKKEVAGTTEYNASISTVLNTSLPPSIVANTIDDYTKGVVDYFYFFVNDGNTNSNGAQIWWQFDSDLDTIIPATMQNGKVGKIAANSKKNKGYITIKDNKIAVSSTFVEATSQKLSSRPLSASAKIFYGSNTSKKENFSFPSKIINVRFAVKRYIKQKNGTWVGKWLPNNEVIASHILSATETLNGAQ